MLLAAHLAYEASQAVLAAHTNSILSCKSILWETAGWQDVLLWSWQYEEATGGWQIT